jgi:hypothetical protein
MPDTTFPVTCGAARGELRLTRHGMSFAPRPAHAAQLGLDLDIDHWFLCWSDVAGIERVMSLRGTRIAGPGGDIRVHHDECLRFIALTVEAPLEQFFASADRLAAQHARPLAA